MNFIYLGNGNLSLGSLNEEIFIDNVIELLFFIVIGLGMFWIIVSWDFLGSLNLLFVELSDGLMMVILID